MTADTQTQLDITAEPVTPPSGTSVPLNAFQLLDALRDHYLMPGHSRPGAVFLTEVTAPDRTHRADAVHVGLWASRGYTVDVCELKASRADFMRELDKPDKAEAWWAHSNTFWIVAPNASVAPPELLPTGWGLMVPGKGRRFKVVVKAEHRDLRPTTALLAALLVSMETDRNNAIERAREQLRNQHWRDLQEARRKAASERDPDLDRRLHALREFEALVGFKLTDPHHSSYGNRLNPADMAAAFKDVVSAHRVTGDAERKLQALQGCAERVLEAVAATRKGLAQERGVPDDIAL